MILIRHSWPTTILDIMVYLLSLCWWPRLVGAVRLLEEAGSTKQRWVASSQDGALSRGFWYSVLRLLEDRESDTAPRTIPFRWQCGADT